MSRVRLKERLIDGRYLFEKEGVHFSLTSRQVLRVLWLWLAALRVLR